MIADQIATPEFCRWLEMQGYGVLVRVGEQWDSKDVWTNDDALFAARTCYRVFGYGALNAAEVLLYEALRVLGEG